QFHDAARTGSLDRVLALKHERGYASGKLNEVRLAQLQATAWVRSMSPGAEGSGSQPHVFETERGAYMVKVSNNPQGEHVLLNELIAGLCLDWLGVRHPAPAVVHVADELIKASPGARFSSGEE